MFSQSQTLMMGFSQPAADASPAKKAAKAEDRQTCLPVTLRSIQTAVDQGDHSPEGLRLFGSEHGMLITVALVESLTKQASSMDLSLSDGSGRVKARYYMTEKPPKSLEEVAVGRYIQAFGNMRLAPEPHFVITGMRVVESADEISYHMIESAHSALKLQRGSNDVPATPSPKKMSMTTDTPAAKVATELGVVTQPTPTEIQAKPAAGALEGAALRSAIVAHLQKFGQDATGVALDAVLREAKAASADDVRKALEQLVDDGEIYTTIDDEHFAVV